MSQIRRLTLAMGAILTAAVLAGCNLVAGDSLIVQAATGTSSPGGLGADKVVSGVAFHGISGTAPCDYRNFVDADIAKYHPAKTTLAFSGNNQTACTGHKTGQALVDQYHSDLVWLTNRLISNHSAVIYSAPICKSPTFGWSNSDPAFRYMEQALAKFYRSMGAHVAYSESAATTVCPGWRYVPNRIDGLHLDQAETPVYAQALVRESNNVNP